jgi:SAM-dependent methyltransferase
MPTWNDIKPSIEQNYDQILPAFQEVRAKTWRQIGFLPTLTTLEFLRRNFTGQDELTMIDVGCGNGEDLLNWHTLLSMSGVSLKARGCDLSGVGVRNCCAHGLDVKRGDYRELTTWLGKAHLVWANLSLIHTPVADLPSALSVLVDMALPGGIVVVGFKTGEDNEKIDPADKRVPVDRFTAFFRVETVRSGLERVPGIKWLASLMVPSASGAEYAYAWVVAQRSAG